MASTAEIFVFVLGLSFSFNDVVGSPSHHATISNIPREKLLYLDGVDLEVIVLKIGGSSLTNKANKESINNEMLNWFSESIFGSIDESFMSPTENCHVFKRYAVNPGGSRRRAFVVVHGAGSFGHHTAREYSLGGKYEPPLELKDSIPTNQDHEARQIRRRAMQGLAETRLSVQTLNRLVVSSLIRNGINAVGISPCLGIPCLQAHGGPQQGTDGLKRIILDCLEAGLVPVLHGDACLYGKDDCGILSGDILVEKIGQENFVSRVIFLTDVEGVFTRDPRDDPDAHLLKTIQIDKRSLDPLDPGLRVTGSSHSHDVTGGLKTKLRSAAVIAASGKKVIITRCGSVSAEEALMGHVDSLPRATTVVCCKDGL